MAGAEGRSGAGLSVEGDLDHEEARRDDELQPPRELGAGHSASRMAGAGAVAAVGARRLEERGDLVEQAADLLAGEGRVATEIRLEHPQLRHGDAQRTAHDTSIRVS